MPYLPGITRPPMNRSTSPSLSTSAALTHDALVAVAVNLFVVSEKPPWPSFTYTRGVSAEEPGSSSFPPYASTRSWSPSLSTSIKLTAVDKDGRSEEHTSELQSQS